VNGMVFAWILGIAGMFLVRQRRSVPRSNYDRVAGEAKPVAHTDHGLQSIRQRARG